MIVGVTKVKQGFSIPPNGKLGGITITSYCFQTYGTPQISSATLKILSVSENSIAASSNCASSAQIFEL